MNDQRRQAAIDAGVEVALRWVKPATPSATQAVRRRVAQRLVAAVIDAAAPHLVVEPVEWIIVNHYGTPAHSGFKDEATASELLQRWNDGRPADSRYRLLALVPVEHAP